MSQENVEVVRRAVAAAFVSDPPGHGDVARGLEPDCVFVSNWGVGEVEHHGLDEALAGRAEMSRVWASWTQEVEQVLDAGDAGVVALLRLRATGSGSAVPVEFPWAIVATLRNGRIATARTVLSQAEALKAVGLEE